MSKMQLQGTKVALYQDFGIWKSDGAGEVKCIFRKRERLMLVSKLQSQGSKGASCQNFGLWRRNGAGSVACIERKSL